MTVPTVVAQVAPVLVFLLAITVVAEIAQVAGVFDVAGDQAARLGRGRLWAMWAWTVAAAVLCTVVLSLDTTAVLLTPVVLAVARRAQVPPLPFAMTTVTLANTASLLLPVSNLTNLLAAYHLGGVRAYLAVSWRPALVAIAVTVGLLAVVHRRALGGRYHVPDRREPADPVLFRVAAGVCLALGPAFALGVPPAWAAVGGALGLAGTLGVRDRGALRRITVPWRLVLALIALFAVVQAALAMGAGSVLFSLTGRGDGAAAHLRLAGVAGVSANLVNNLPAYLALEPTAVHDPHRLMALLIGVGVVPVVTLWGSLATLLWRQRCVSAGVTVGAGQFALHGLLVALPAALAAVLVL
jgi:arsenical pump membrane protein